MRRVSVVGVAGGEVSFAPHDHGAWVRLPLGSGVFDDEPCVGQVGDLEGDPEEWIFVLEPSLRVEECVLTAAGSSRRMYYQLGSEPAEVDLSGHGVDRQLKKEAEQLGFWRLVSADPEADLRSAIRGHFNHPDLAGWAERQRLARKARGRRAHQLANSADYFVNPYTFVPFPDEPPRRNRPRYHHELVRQAGVQCYSGRLVARLRARSPLLVRNIGSEAPVEAGVARAPRKDGRLFVPGSSLHGAVRAMHETLTGSCLRVFDPDFVPVYRDVASVGLRRDWGLGVIAKVDPGDANGRPTQVIACARTAWVHLSTLHAAMRRGIPVTTGQRFTLAGAFPLVNGRPVYDESVPAVHDDANGQWVVLVTDPAARDETKSYYVAVGQLPATSETVEVTATAWEAFRKAAAGAKWTYPGEPQPTFEAERQRLRTESLAEVLGGGPARSTEFSWPPKNGTAKGRWLRPRPWLHEGQVVWIKKSRGGLTGGIALSFLWRSAGRGSAADRLPASGFQACHDSDELCPSCRVFGSADLAEDRSVDRRRATQCSYRGHVRFLDAVATDAGVLPEPVMLPAAGSPRPGSGQFYLTDTDPDTAATSPPRNRWGGIDATRPRVLRGRKFYWHTDPATDERRRRWRWHDDGAAASSGQAELVAAGGTFELSIRFDGLSSAEIGGLVAALQPQALFDLLDDPLPYPTDGEVEYAVHIGGGKQWGLGSCQVDGLDIEIDTAESRYLDEVRPSLAPVEAVTAFSREHGHLRQTWSNLAAALHTAHVDSRIVGYPTAQPWADHDGSCSGKGQHESFTWFQATTGEKLKQGERAFVALPQVSDIAPGLPVNGKDGG